MRWAGSTRDRCDFVGWAKALLAPCPPSQATQFVDRRWARCALPTLHVPKSCKLQPMEWTDEGIVLGVRRHGESSAIVELLTREHGRHLGLGRGGSGKRMRPPRQPCNSVP